MAFLTAESITGCTWYEFERYIFRALQHSGWTGLIFTSKSNDKGADIVGILPSGKGVGVVQCKHTGSSTIGKNGIEDLRRACDFYGTNKGILATNARLSAGAKERLQVLKQQYNFVVWDFTALLKLSANLKPYSASKRDPRKYQEIAIADVMAEFNQGVGACLVVFATGLGKSIILSEISVEFAENRERPVLLLADRTQLIEQLEASLWPQLNVSTETRLWDADRKPRNFEGITVATQQSVYSAIKKGEILPRFGAVLVDECHHAASPTYRETLDLLDYDRLLGVTATPWRGDEQSLDDIFGEPLCTVGLVEGIKRGFLAEVDYTMYLDDIDWACVQKLSKQKLSIKDLNARLFLPARDEELCKSIVEAWFENEKPLTITFCRSINHAERIAELLSVMGMPSRAIHSRKMTRSDQSRLLMEFRTGSFANLVSVDVLNEGVDVPDVGMVVFARITHSRRIFVQQLGRGLRVTETKKRVTVLDFVADIRRISEGYRMNKEAMEFDEKASNEFYRGKGAELVQFSKLQSSNFVDEYLSDIANLDDKEKVDLDFILD